MPRKRTSDYKAAVWKELQAGENIVEAYLEDENQRERIYGLAEGQSVYVNTAPHVLDTLVHELLHRSCPKMAEHNVRINAARIIASMTDQEIRRWHRQYQRVVKTRTRPVTVE